jgi:hypothetical protein
MLGKWPYTLVSTETYYARRMRSAKFLNSDPPLCLCAGVTRVSRRRTAPFWPARLPLLRRSSLARSVRLVDMLVQNIADTDMQFFSVFPTFKFAEFSLSDWLAHSPPGMVGGASERRFGYRSAPAWNRRAHQNLIERIGSVIRTALPCTCKFERPEVGRRVKEDSRLLSCEQVGAPCRPNMGAELNLTAMVPTRISVRSNRRPDSKTFLRCRNHQPL